MCGLNYVHHNNIIARYLTRGGCTPSRAQKVDRASQYLVASILKKHNMMYIILSKILAQNKIWRLLPQPSTFQNLRKNQL